MQKTPRPQLDRSTWIQAAFDTLADEGVGGIRVEILARRLHVTKGSFYWHFKDRQDLLDGILETWKVGRIRDIVKQTRPEAGHEEAQLFHVIDVYSASRNNKGILIELAVREWAREVAGQLGVHFIERGLDRGGGRRQRVPGARGDAHELYRKYGWTDIADPAKWMELHNKNVYST